MTEGRAEMDKAQIRKAFESAAKTDDIESFEDPILLRLTGLTWNEIRELKERDTAKAAIITGYNCAIGCKVGECPTCGAMTRDYLEFCSECGQRIKWED